MQSDYSDIFPIAPSDVTNFMLRGIFVQTAGLVNLRMKNDTLRSVTLPVGYHPLRVKQIRTGTAATVYGLL